MYLFDSLHMAYKALNISQLGIQVAGQNLNNADVPGYTRATLQLATDTSRQLGNGTVVGTGAQVAGLVQVIDQFLEERLRLATGDAMSSGTQQKYYTQLENLLNATTSSDLSTSILNFFNAIDNVLNHPEDVTYRRMAVEQGIKLVNDINSLAGDVMEMQLDINRQIEHSADEINRLLKEIEDLNTQITLLETKQGFQAVGLRDQRYVALTTLSNYISIKTTEDSKTGQVTIHSGSNILLTGGYRAEIKVGYPGGEESNVVMAQLCIGNNNMTPLDVRGGSVFGLYQAHQTILGGYLDKLDTFAGQLVTEFNKIYTSGQGLTGYTDLTSLFRVENANMPIGSMPIGVAPLDVPVVNGGFIIQVYDTSTGATIPHYIEINVDESVAHNPFSLKTPPAPTGTTFQDLANAINAIEGLYAKINAHGELEIRSEGGNVEFAFAQDTSGVLSALGLNTFFTGVKAGALGVNQVLVDDPSKFAASQSGVGADTETGVFLAALAITPNSALGGATLINRYNGIVSETMMAGATMKAVTSANMLYHNSLQAQRDSISGVNIDEETILMMTYQRMFQANSRFVTIVDQMMSMLLSI
ncbi:MAG: flagellar hook-associated protein FlgK [Planctomycetaceae bacterium]|nr:flagellar hook-associated protein FlgK [Planctomycetaceae bacterium]